MKDIPGFEGRYAATEDGRIWSYRSKKYLSSPVGSSGYKVVVLSPERKLFTVNRLMLAAYYGWPKNKKDSCHINGDKTDNRIENLVWGTRGFNVQSNKYQGRQRKLCSKTVYEIKKYLLYYRKTPKELAEKYSVSYSTIYDIKAERTHRDVKV